MVLTSYGRIFQLGVDGINLMLQVENVLKGRAGFLEYRLFPEDKTFLGKVASICIF